ncbi:hypothetical protein GCM10010840_36390 [Deinococcus aerolatus]|uniref:Uncharacterized protein n=1 Tax=Deinococcus aerolatus TaxID=522487 RepID=A0ABQ2GGB7_9DEIO|nr:hypothetical protein [Deinococcus aerolatus]GGL95038.1 hypothetical protein GCM10010840_36390 [Deinococcus aerolatus]
MSNTFPHHPSVTITRPELTADTVLDDITTRLPTTARAIFTLLFDTAVSTLQTRGHSQGVSQVVIHQPVEIMCRVLAISRVTFYKHLRTLKTCGLVDSRGHTADWYGLARKTGTVFAVSFKAGHSARLRWFDLKHQWRNLQADTESGTRTAWRFLQGLQSHPSAKTAANTALKAWAVKPGTTSKPVTNDCKPTATEYVYSLDLLTDTHPTRRAESVDRYAKALAAGYGDHTNLNFWRWLLWRSIEGDQIGQNTLYQLQNALTRLKADIEEWKGLKSPGALLVHRLKVAGIWDSLSRT